MKILGKKCSYCLGLYYVWCIVGHRRMDFDILRGKIIIAQWTEIVKSDVA